MFAALWAREGDSADAIIEARGLKQISDAGAIEKIVDEVLAANPKSVEEFRAGKEKAFNALVGQAMKATRGQGESAAGERDPAAAAGGLSTKRKRPRRAALSWLHRPITGAGTSVKFWVAGASRRCRDLRAA